MKENDRKVLFSSKKHDHVTPQVLFDNINNEFNFTLDVAASQNNYKCSKFFTENENGLNQSWEGETTWCNPPYGRETKKWLEKGYSESRKDNLDKVFLVASRTDTKWFFNAAMKAASIYFIKGRLKFEGTDSSAPFPSAIIVFNRCMEGKRNVQWCDREFKKFW